MTPLAILGTGMVAATGAPRLHPRLSAPAENLPALHVPDEALARWAREPRLRRASRLTVLLAEAAAQALGPGPRSERLGIVGAFFTGPSRSSRQFFQPVVERGASFASPAVFPETVYNSALSHLAAIFGVNGACYALVGDETAWVAALQAAAVWLDLGTCDQVLVVAGEELDVSAMEAYAAARWFRGGWLPAEGAAALLLSRAQSGCPHVTGLVDPIPYRTRADAAAAARTLASLARDAPALATAGNTWLCGVAADAFPAAIPPAPTESGHAFAATAGHHTIAAIAQPGPVWVPVWGMDQAVAGLRVHPAPPAA